MSDRSRNDLEELFGRRGGQAGAGPPTGASTGGLSPELAALLRELEEARRWGDQLTRDLSERQFNWHTEPSRWSVAECLGHLDLVGSELLPRLDAAIAQARVHAWYRQAPPRVGFFGRRLIAETEPPVRHRHKARPEHVVSGEQALDIVVPAFRDLNDQLIGRVRASNGLDIGRPRVAAFGSIVFKPTVYELLLFVAAHQRRHLAQAQAVRDDPGFPKRLPGVPRGGH